MCNIPNFNIPDWNEHLFEINNYLVKFLINLKVDVNDRRNEMVCFDGFPVGSKVNGTTKEQQVLVLSVDGSSFEAMVAYKIKYDKIFGDNLGLLEEADGTIVARSEDVLFIVKPKGIYFEKIGLFKLPAGSPNVTTWIRKTTPTSK